MTRSNKYIFFALFSLWFLPSVQGQNNIPVGQWRTHFNYYQGYKVARLNNRIYCNSYHSLVEVDLETQAISKITKANGLSDVGITAMAADEASGSLLLGYVNGNIDILRDSETINLDDLLRANITSGKAITNIFVGDETFFATTGFGVLEIDLQSYQIVNDYQDLGRNGSSIGVLDGGVKGDSIVLATTNGIISGNRQTSNLLDFRNWKRALENAGQIDFVEVSANISYAGSRQGRLWVNHGSGWEEITFGSKPEFLKLENGVLLYGSGNQLFKRAADGQTSSQTLGVTSSVKDAFTDGQDIWLADDQNGLGQYRPQGLAYYVVPGPFEKTVNDIAATNDRLITLGGGFEYNGLIPFNRQASVSSFGSEGWEPVQPGGLPSYKDASAVAFTSNADDFYILSYGKGIVRNSTGELIDHETPGSFIVDNNGFVPVTAIAVDQDDNLIISSNQAFDKYMMRTANGTWEPLSFIPGSVPPAVSLQQNAFGDFWGILPHSSSAGVIVFNVESEQYRVIGSTSGLPSSTIYDIAFDADNYAWLATSAGLAIVANTYEVFDGADLLVTNPVAENAFVLSEEPIHAVVVDGANRKWVGSERGLFLLDEFGAGSLTPFTRDDSPLPSNNIRHLAINGASGELFVLTPEGLVSYRTTATTPKAVMKTAKIFPNPVRPGFNGLVAIEGLAFDAVVKITDEAGRLVREMVSTGGTATWNLADYNGSRVASGIYIVLAASRDGNQSVVGKIAVIN
jgi:hypothetical protein